MQDLASKITGDAVAATEWNQIPKELQNLITAVNLVLAGGNLDQVGQALSVLGMASAFYTDTGGTAAADIHDLEVITGYQGAGAFSDGMQIMFRPANNCTGGAVTVVVNGLAIKNIRAEDGVANPSVGDIVTGHDVRIRYDLGGDEFLLIFESASSDQYIAFAPDHFQGFLHNREAVQDINVALGGSCRDIDDTFNIVTALNRTKRIEETWLEGDDAGGMNDTDHPVVVDQWYRYWALSKLDGTVDYGWTIDTDAVGANLLGDSAVGTALYVKIQQIGWHKTNVGDTNIIDYRQGVANPDEILWELPIEDISSVPPTATQASLTLTAAPSSIAKFYIDLISDTAADVTAHGLIMALALTDSVPTASLYNVSGKSDTTNTGPEISGANFETEVDASSQIGSRWDSVLGDISIATSGYIYKRGN